MKLLPTMRAVYLEDLHRLDQAKVFFCNADINHKFEYGG